MKRELTNDEIEADMWQGWNEAEGNKPIFGTTGPKWSEVKRFNFTYAIDGGAWLEWGPFVTSDGPKVHREWYSFTLIAKHLGQDWIDRQLKKQGWMTGCWIDVV